MNVQCRLRTYLRSGLLGRSRLRAPRFSGMHRRLGRLSSTLSGSLVCTGGWQSAPDQHRGRVRALAWFAIAAQSKFRAAVVAGRRLDLFDATVVPGLHAPAQLIVELATEPLADGSRPRRLHLRGAIVTDVLELGD